MLQHPMPPPTSSDRKLSVLGRRHRDRLLALLLPKLVIKLSLDRTHLPNSDHPEIVQDPVGIMRHETEACKLFQA